MANLSASAEENNRDANLGTLYTAPRLRISANTSAGSVCQRHGLQKYGLKSMASVRQTPYGKTSLCSTAP